MSKLCERSAVFAGCARDCAQHLDAVLANVERMAALYGKAAFVFVENDSQDDTKARLLRWLSSRPQGTLLQLDGLALIEPGRTARLARARNAYLAELRGGPYRDYDDLIVLDFDEVNASPIDTSAFAAAAEFLHADARTVGVFANSSPVYFDIWALRHPVWCPGDCWADIRAIRHLPPAQAIERLLYARQIAINPGQAPIPVESAFGGLGLYRLALVLVHRYVGSNPDGTEVCEHVSLNTALSGDGQLFIYPALQNFAPPVHLRPRQIPARALELEQDGRRCSLLAPPEYRLDAGRAAQPLALRPLPRLARLLATAAPQGVLIEADAGIGETVVRCRLAGCDAPFVAIEPSEVYFSFLEANRQALPELFKHVRTVRGELRDLGQLGEQQISLLSISAHERSAAMLGANVAFLRDSGAVIWVRAAATSPGAWARWPQLCTNLAPAYSHLCLLRHSGAPLAHGPLLQTQAALFNLTNDAVEMVLFPASRFELYTTFVSGQTTAPAETATGP
jgi:hypothetical protein